MIIVYLPSRVRTMQKPEPNDAWRIFSWVRTTHFYPVPLYSQTGFPQLDVIIAPILCSLFRSWLAINMVFKKRLYFIIYICMQQAVKLLSMWGNTLIWNYLSDFKNSFSYMWWCRWSFQLDVGFIVLRGFACFFEYVGVVSAVFLYQLIYISILQLCKFACGVSETNQTISIILSAVFRMDFLHGLRVHLIPRVCLHSLPAQAASNIIYRKSLYVGTGLSPQPLTRQFFSPACGLRTTG